MSKMIVHFCPPDRRDKAPCGASTAKNPSAILWCRVTCKNCLKKVPK